ncbi:hypothetical protein [Lentzea sp. NPDC059081]|uniref:hypothetical protein n=1 Tax=Lentzea sp. NPDC059081 TaxID=3346719 RepID=UPI0036A406A5
MSCRRLIAAAAMTLAAVISFSGSAAADTEVRSPRPTVDRVPDSRPEPGVASAAPDPFGGAVRQAELEWKLVGVYPTYDACYWDGFDGWNNYQWDRWICPESSGLFWLMVGDN